MVVILLHQRKRNEKSGLQMTTADNNGAVKVKIKCCSILLFVHWENAKRKSGLTSYQKLKCYANSGLK